ncbi:MAG: 50S ribosomal protein L3 [Candidatus Nanoarchaeia archaeon]|nr:50S ribosomal protein L3 [Candidatus Nanoarchaeia archaeon]MDD5741709.1 50S ribosomal protein L3 [Candidatus Nanoarchaeia archaeon]
MPRHSQPRRGSLQFYPRKRANKLLPRVNWDSISKQEKGLKGFIGYKVGMKSAYVLDNTQHSLTKGKRIIIPLTIIECPTIKILSVRFYKNKNVVKEILNDNLDKELKSKLKLPAHKKQEKLEDFKGDYDDIRVIFYSQVKKTGIKKRPDIAEIGLSGTKEEKLEFAKDNLNREISIKDIFKTGIIDVRGVTKGKGLQGQVKRFGLSLKAHKSEKGIRTLGTGGAWHPCRVTFREPRAGQMGFFTRVVYNNKIISVSSITEKDINPKQGFKHFGRIRTDYLLVFGSIQGPSKRQLLITTPLRPDKGQLKKNYELIELR